ncbi:MAG: hypothetical protein Q6366_002225 [Candidatus Freyarchaeota archaeon]
MIYDLYILTKEGLCVLHRKYGSLNYDETLITGFLSAISSFSRDISGEELELIVMGDKQFVSIPSENMFFVAYSDKGDKLKSTLLRIREEFIKKYGNIGAPTIDKSDINEFITILDKIVGKSGEPGLLDLSDVKKLFDDVKKKIAAIPTLELDFPDFNSLINNLKTGVSHLGEAVEKIVKFYNKIRRKEN